MPSSNTSLPLELEDMIIQHLSGNKDALRSCALVSRTWSVFSQRALFRNTEVNLDTYKRMTKLLDDLTSIPHLQTLICDVCIHHPLHNDDIPLSAHMSCLTSVLSLLPNLMKFALKDNFDDDILATRCNLDLFLNVLGNARLAELDIAVRSVESFQTVFESLIGTSVKQVTLCGFVDDHTVDFGAPRKRLHLPSLEGIRFGVNGLQEEFYHCLTRHFDLPNLKRCEIVTCFVDDLGHWQDILLRGFPPLELFKLELESEFVMDLEYYSDIAADDAFSPVPLGGLPFQHVHLIVNTRYLNDTRQFIEWWSSTFRALSDSKATIHFSELTFTFTDFQDSDTLDGALDWLDDDTLEAWDSLDKSLAHTTFSGVRSIRFERRGWQGPEAITQTAYYPVFADRMRFVLPRLASRGVLRFD